MFIVTHRKLFYIFSGVLVCASIVFLAVWGLQFGIDFTGGSLLEVRFTDVRPEIPILQERLNNVKFGSAVLQPSEESNLLIRTRDITETEHQIILQALAGDTEPAVVLEELRFDSIGPVIGNELRRKSFTALLLVLLMILIFITWSFRKVSRPVASWKYGLVALIALAHDVIIPVGLFSLLGQFYHVEVGTLFVTALLTILGFSVHDTIIVFDRIRENITRIGSTIPFEEVVGKSLSEVMGRSIATSFTLFVVLFLLFLFGESSTTFFSLTLLVGVVAGTYSSIFLASPLIVTWQQFSSRK
ncbi:MAG: protein translocase subunit SecF [Candidatus Niyogibacteria bacterium CG10_big_fil_rev_8_21_14_0_10_46_36]|uniref:Protein-export membrane protein SecF n=1 Tax=Candidatus Niyogibacteria bacterium CG10_big_fil_rev_8_21_14_0_10_46_36 TaxID=1974726 RepID=A0A2H0TEB9_9BACT|nr:MAG: protein translocase subunit SecF [Candidatus Niyogibacteria bacterium CG10_big_fil_rev_8_21_14_0_10_46_36]